MDTILSAVICALVITHQVISSQAQQECEVSKNGVTICRNVLSTHELKTKALADWSKLMIINEPDKRFLVEGLCNQ